MMLKQTKIVASISDLRCDVDFIRELFEAGMNVVRMNTAHASREGFEKLIANVREVSNRIAILMDTKGPEIRTTSLVNKEPIPFHIGDRVKVTGNPEQETSRDCISVSYPDFVKDLKVDGTILIDDGDLELRVIEKCEDYLLCEVQNEATLGNRKSVNVPGVRINLPSLTEKDRNNILFAIESDIDFIAHPLLHRQCDGTGVSVQNRQGAGGHIAGETVVVRKLYLAGSVDSGQVGYNCNVAGIDLIQIRTVAVDFHGNSGILAANDHQITAGQNALAFQNHGDIVVGLGGLGTDHGHHIHPQAKGDQN